MSSSSSAVGSDLDGDGGLALLLERRVQRGEALELDALLADRHLLAGEIVDRVEDRRARPGHDDFSNVGLGGNREVDEPGSLRRDRDVRRHDVASAVNQRLIEVVARRREEGDEDTSGLRGLQLCVDVRFQLQPGLVHDAPWHALVDEVVGLAVRRQDPDAAALNHAVEVARPWFFDIAEESRTALLRRRRRLPAVRDASLESSDDEGAARERQQPPAGQEHLSTIAVNVSRGLCDFGSQDLPAVWAGEAGRAGRRGRDSGTRACYRAKRAKPAEAAHAASTGSMNCLSCFVVSLTSRRRTRRRTRSGSSS